MLEAAEEHAAIAHRRRGGTKKAALEANRSLPQGGYQSFSIPSLPTFTLKVNAFGKASVI